MHIHAVIKFGNKKWMDRFQKGEIYLQQLKQFQNLEKQSSSTLDAAKRGDQYEGAHRIFSPEKAEISFGDIKIDANDLVGPIRIHIDAISNQPIFCLYALTEDNVKQFLESESSILIDSTVENFGDTAVLITNFEEFLRRLEKALNQKYNVGFEKGLVEYLDVNEVNGEWGAFRKPLDYKFQSEYRILIEMPIKKPELTLNIGDIRDITFSVPIENVHNIKFQYNE